MAAPIMTHNNDVTRDPLIAGSALSWIPYAFASAINARMLPRGVSYD